MCIWYIWLHYLVFWLCYFLYLGMLLENFSIDNISYVFIPKLGSRVPQWGPVNITCPSVSLSLRLFVSLSSRPRQFLVIKTRGP